MSADTTSYVVWAPVSTAAPRLEKLRLLLLALTAFSGAFVFIEPSPYEVLAVSTMLVFVVTGLTLSAALMPLLLLLVFINIGYSIAVMPLLGGDTKLVTWVVVSWYMAASAVFFAAMLRFETQARLDALIRGYMCAAVVTSLVAVLAYFRLLPNADLFLRFERARGTFNDPNVLAAFLVFPTLIAWQRVLSGSLSTVLWGGLQFALFATALLLSFSRGAWGQVAFSLAFLMLLDLVTSTSVRDRTRIIVIAGIGAAAIAMFLVALLSMNQVADLFQERASLDQKYDTGHTGRFGRHLLGFIAALERPLGLGPLQFVTVFGEDPHNSYLNAFMSGGWLTGFAYLTLVLITLATGFRYIFAVTPWRNTYHVVFTACLGTAGESLIIDTDHWRHYFLLLGVLWGLIVASQKYPSATAANRSPREAGLLQVVTPERR